MRILGGILTFVFMTAAAGGFMVLLDVLCGVDMFSPFDRESWHRAPWANAVKSVVLMLAVTFVILCTVAAFAGEIPILGITDSSQWEPAW